MMDNLVEFIHESIELRIQKEEISDKKNKNDKFLRNEIIHMTDKLDLMQ
jgi:hypothetical protein